MSDNLSNLSDSEIMRRRQAFEERERAKRPCLRCNRSFKSDGPWNRICADCHHRIDESDEKERQTRAGLSYQKAGRQSEGGL